MNPIILSDYGYIAGQAELFNLRMTNDLVINLERKELRQSIPFKDTLFW